MTQTQHSSTGIQTPATTRKPTAIQTAFLGSDVVAGDIKERVRHILHTYPETRNSYKALLFWYWYEFDGLRDVLGDLNSMRDAFRTWLTQQATSPKTLQNRAMEVQNEDPDLEASQTVRDWRTRQSKAGVVK